MLPLHEIVTFSSTLCTKFVIECLTTFVVFLFDISTACLPLFYVLLAFSSHFSPLSATAKHLPLAAEYANTLPSVRKSKAFVQHSVRAALEGAPANFLEKFLLLVEKCSTEEEKAQLRAHRSVTPAAEVDAIIKDIATPAEQVCAAEESTQAMPLTHDIVQS